LLWFRKEGIWPRLVVITAVLVVVIAAPAVSSAEQPQPDTEVLTLVKALGLAREEHPLVRAAQLSLDSSELALTRSEAAYAPKLSLSSRPLVTRNGEVEISLADSLTVTGSLSTPQGLGLSASNRWEGESRERRGLTVRAELQLWPPARYNAGNLNLLAAEEALDLTGYQLQQAREEAVIDIYSRYRTLQIDAARLKLQEEEYQAKLAAYERVVGISEQGLASAVEVLAARQAVEESLAEYQRAQREYRLKLKTFLADLSLEEGTWELEPLPETLTLPGVDISLEEAIAMALEAAVTLLEQIQNLKAAQRQLEAARTANGFEVNLSASVSFSEDQQGDDYSAYLSFSYPLLDGGSRRLAVEEAELSLRRAEEAVVKRRSELSREVEHMLSEIQYLADKVKIANLNYEKTALEHNAKVLQAANGLIPESEARESQRLLAGAKLSWFEAAVALEKARLELRMMTGQVMDVEGGDPN